MRLIRRREPWLNERDGISDAETRPNPNAPTRVGVVSLCVVCGRKERDREEDKEKERTIRKRARQRNKEQIRKRKKDTETTPINPSSTHRNKERKHNKNADNLIQARIVPNPVSERDSVSE